MKAKKKKMMKNISIHVMMIIVLIESVRIKIHQKNNRKMNKLDKP